MRSEAKNITPVTAKEIGYRLGLSQPTVSRILSDAKGYRVSPETRRRVLEAAAQMGYRPNAVARSLRQRRTNIVGFYTGYGYLDARNAFLAALIGGLQRACDGYRLDLLLHGVFRGASTDDIYGELVDGRIDGLFVHTHADDPLVARLRESSLPVVALADAVPGLPSVVADDAEGMRLLIGHLWTRGHRRIAYVRPTRHFSSVEVRGAAFEQSMRAHGVAAPEDRPVFEIEMESAAPVLDRLLTLPEPPTAVCCWNDMAAYDLLHACRQRGIGVPQQVAIVGFDGLFDPRLTGRRLVTVSTAWDEVARCGVDRLVRRINSGESRPESVGDPDAGSLSPTVLPVSLVEGDTV